MAALEPINSVMSFQAQPVQSAQITKEAQSVAEKPAAEYTESASKQAAAAVDGKTVVVDSVGQTETDADGNPQGRESQDASQSQIRKAVEDLNKKIDNTNNEVQFGIHEGTKRVTIKVIDKDTKKVVKEFPPEKTLDMIAKVWEMAGIMVDEKR